MRLKWAIALLTLPALAAAGPAAAMWDGIRWNMSEREVLAAGRGQLAHADGWAGRRVKPTRRPALTLKDRVAGERVIGGVRVQTTFWFNPDGRLWSVTEEPLEADGPAAETCARLDAALAERYGERDLVTDKGELRHVIWRDETKKTRIHFREGEGGDCAIEYRELRGPLDR
ncbi:MAG TPA: hypothetical protein VIF14_03835 [Alphaproteobacteria bacterium]|jgi:hypothetical protein